MKNCAVAIVFGVLFSPVVLNAEAPSEYLEAIRSRSFADGLYHQVYVDADCPVDKEDVDNQVTSELVRSRLSPTELRHLSVRVLTLHANVFCMARESGWPSVFDIEVYFSYRDENHVEWMLFWQYGAFGIGDSDFIMDSIEDGVEEAITDFIRAHS